MLGLKKTPVTQQASNHPAVSPEDFALLAIGAGIERKAFAPVLLDLRNQHAFTEYFAILSANNPRQVAAVAEGIKTFCREQLGVRPLSVDGMESLNWVLIDFGFLFIHIFQTETRSIYRLEEVWSKARLIPVDEAAFLAVRSQYGIDAKS
jgi:ribosome-associated protein